MDQITGLLRIPPTRVLDLHPETPEGFGCAEDLRLCSSVGQMEWNACSIE